MISDYFGLKIIDFLSNFQIIKLFISNHLVNFLLAKKIFLFGQYKKIGDNFKENDFYEVVREVGGDLVEKVEKFDEFFSKKKNKKSQAYRIIYRSFERTLTNEEVDKLQFDLRDALQNQLDIQLR